MVIGVRFNDFGVMVVDEYIDIVNEKIISVSIVLLLSRLCNFLIFRLKILCKWCIIFFVFLAVGYLSLLLVGWLLVMG